MYVMLAAEHALPRPPSSPTSVPFDTDLSTESLLTFRHRSRFEPRDLDGHHAVAVTPFVAGVAFWS